LNSPQLPREAVSTLDRWLGGNQWTATQIAGDASVRAYYRIGDRRGSTTILTYYPPEAREGLARFVESHEALRGIVPIPSLLESNEACVLQEDVGDLSLARLLSDDRDAAIAR